MAVNVHTESKNAVWWNADNDFPLGLDVSESISLIWGLKEREREQKIMQTNGRKTERETVGWNGKEKKSETLSRSRRAGWQAGSTFLMGSSFILSGKYCNVDEIYTEDKRTITIKKSRNSAVLFRQALIFNIRLTCQTHMDVMRVCESERERQRNISTASKLSKSPRAYYLHRQQPSKEMFPKEVDVNLTSM